MKVARKATAIESENELILINNNERIENVNEFIYLESLITNYYDDDREIRRNWEQQRVR